MDNRDRLASRLGFILVSAGCAIGCGNVWKFPWMCGRYGGAGFILIYLLCLFILGLPALTIELALGRKAQTSPLNMMRVLERPGQRWHLFGYLFLFANISLMAFYSVVSGWIIYYFVMFLTGRHQTLSFSGMISDPVINVFYLLITVLFAFSVLTGSIQKGLERVSKFMMIALLLLLVLLGIHSFFLPNAAEGFRFYLVPDLAKIDGSTLVAAMNQAFFTLSVGIGSMGIFGSYIDKSRSLLGESIHIVVIDTLVALLAGFIIFPACFAFGLEVNAGPSLLFDSMASVFVHMEGGRWWGTLFFLLMIFAALSTVIAVCENILAMVRELTGLSRPKGCALCAAVVFLCALTTALGFNVLHFEPFAPGSTWLDLWDFIVSNNALPLGAFAMTLFCTHRIGIGWQAFLEEANAGKGLKISDKLRPLFGIIVPILIFLVYIYGLATFNWR